MAPPEGIGALAGVALVLPGRAPSLLCETHRPVARFEDRNETVIARTYKVAGIAGSQRAGSFNTAALRAARELAPDTLDIELVTLEDVPLFNADIEARGWPARIQDLRDRVGNADAVIFASTEYNYSITGS